MKASPLPFVLFFILKACITFGQFSTELTLKLDLKVPLKAGLKIKKCWVIGEAPKSGWSAKTELTDTDRDSIFLARIDISSADIQHLIAYQYVLETDEMIRENLTGRVFTIKDTTAFTLEDVWNEPRVLKPYEEPFLSDIQIKEDKELLEKAIKKLHPSITGAETKWISNWLDTSLNGEFTHRQFFQKLYHLFSITPSLNLKLSVHNQSLAVNTLFTARKASLPYRLKIERKALWVDEILLDNQWSKVNLPLAMLEGKSATDVLNYISFPLDSLAKPLNSTIELDTSQKHDLSFIDYFNGINNYNDGQIALSVINQESDTLRYVLDEVPIRQPLVQTIKSELKNNRLTIVINDSPDLMNTDFILKEIQKNLEKLSSVKVDTILLDLTNLTSDYTIKADELIRYFIFKNLEIKNNKKVASIQKIENDLMPFIVNQKSIKRWNLLARVKDKDAMFALKESKLQIVPIVSNWPGKLIILSSSYTSGLGRNIMRMFLETNQLNWAGVEPHVWNSDYLTENAFIKLPNSGIVIKIPLEAIDLELNSDSKLQEKLLKSKIKF